MHRKYYLLERFCGFRLTFPFSTWKLAFLIGQQHLKTGKEYISSVRLFGWLRFHEIRVNVRILNAEARDPIYINVRVFYFSLPALSPFPYIWSLPLSWNLIINSQASQVRVYFFRYVGFLHRFCFSRTEFLLQPRTQQCVFYLSLPLLIFFFAACDYKC